MVLANPLPGCLLHLCLQPQNARLEGTLPVPPLLLQAGGEFRHGEAHTIELMFLQLFSEPGVLRKERDDLILALRTPGALVRHLRREDGQSGLGGGRGSSFPKDISCGGRPTTNYGKGIGEATSLSKLGEPLLQGPYMLPHGGEVVGEAEEAALLARLQAFEGLHPVLESGDELSLLLRVGICLELLRLSRRRRGSERDRSLAKGIRHGRPPAREICVV